MYTSSHLSPFSSSFITSPPIYRSIHHLHRRRNPSIPIPIYNANDFVSNHTYNTDNTNTFTSHYRIPITDLSSTKENHADNKPTGVSVVHEKPSVVKANWKLHSPTNPFEEAEQRKSDFRMLDTEWQHEIAKRKAIDLDRMEQEELNKALNESLEIEKERQRVEQEEREQEELEMALRISEEEARQQEIYNEIQKSLRLKKESSIKKGKAKFVDEENLICDNTREDEEPCKSPTVLTRFNSSVRSKIQLNAEPPLPYPNTSLITVNMWGKQRFMRRFYVDETIHSIRNWVETFNMPQNYCMKITSPTYLSGIKFSDVDMAKSIQDINLYPHGEISIEPC